MAGALGLYLGGPNYYGGQLIDKPVIGAGGQQATKESVDKALKLVKVSTILALALAVLVEGLMLWLFDYPLGWGLG
jgi:adenosylcobinamide-phosphate synthase